jgi:hypothetical protein
MPISTCSRAGFLLPKVSVRVLLNANRLNANRLNANQLTANYNADRGHFDGASRSARAVASVLLAVFALMAAPACEATIGEQDDTSTTSFPDSTSTEESSSSSANTSSTTGDDSATGNGAAYWDSFRWGQANWQ